MFGWSSSFGVTLTCSCVEWQSHFLLLFDLRPMTTAVPPISGMHAGLTGKSCGRKNISPAQRHGRFLMIFLVTLPPFRIQKRSLLGLGLCLNRHMFCCGASCRHCISEIRSARFRVRVMIFLGTRYLHRPSILVDRHSGNLAR